MTLMNNKDFPHVIYFDTNVIRELSFGISNVEFLKLKEFCNKYKIGLAVPEPVAYEWYYLQKKEVISENSKIKQSIKKLDLLLDIKQREYKEPKKSFPTLLNKVNKYLHQAEMRLVRLTRKISIRNLMLMAANKTRPFEEKREKGFRDMLILSTMIEDMKKRDYTKGIFITNDDIFTHQDVQAQIKQRLLSIEIIDSFSNAQKYLEGVLDTKVMEYVKKENDELLEYIKSNSKEIFDYVIKNAEVSRDFLEGHHLFAKSEDKIFGNIEKVLEVKPLLISSVFPSLTLKKDPLPENQKYITFSVDTEFRLVVKPYNFFDKPKFPISNPAAYEKVKYDYSQAYIPANETKITRDINVEAIVTKFDSKYSDLKIARIITY